MIPDSPFARSSTPAQQRMNTQPCDCHILRRDGSTLDSSHGDQPCSTISRVELCPMHAAAPDQHAALRAIEARIVGRWDDPDLVAILGPLGTSTERDVLAIARAAIAKAQP